MRFAFTALQAKIFLDIFTLPGEVLCNPKSHNTPLVVPLGGGPNTSPPHLLHLPIKKAK